MWGLILVFAGFLFEWFAIIFKWNRIKPFTKALAMVILILWTLFVQDFSFTPLVTLLFAAQIFGLAGDIFLLFPDRWFEWGLGAFLVGHVFYLILIVKILVNGFRLAKFSALSIGAWFIVSFAVLAFIYLFYRVIVTVLLREHPGAGFIAALFVYALCLTSVMVFSYLTAALLYEGTWYIWALPLGGTLFFASDFMLAYDRFVKRLRNGQFWVMFTYLLGQFFLALGFITLIPRG